MRKMRTHPWCGMVQVAGLVVLGAGCAPEMPEREATGAAGPGSGEERRIVVSGEDDVDPVAPEGTTGDTSSGTGTTQGADQSGAPAPDQTPPDGCGNAYESEVVRRVNEERAKVGLPAYACDPLAGKVAHDYSQVMCDEHWFNHTGPDGSSPFDRMVAGGVGFKTAGENIAAGWPGPAQVMQAWMTSPGHRSNILGSFAYLGVGYAKCGAGAYWTQDFWR